MKVIWGPGDFNNNLKQANLLLDSAIKTDPKYIIAYQNKLNNLIHLQVYKRAINVADSLLKIKSIPEIITTKGFLLQKTGNMVAAKQCYHKALKDSQAMYESKPSAGTLCNIAYLHSLINGQQKALEYLNRQKIKFSKEPRALKQINHFEKDLPNLTVDKMLGKPVS